MGVVYIVLATPTNRTESAVLYNSLVIFIYFYFLGTSPGKYKEERHNFAFYLLKTSSRKELKRGREQLFVMGSDGIVPSNMEDLLEGGGTLGRLLREECGSMVDAIAKLVHQTGGAILEPRADGASLLHRLALMGLYEGVKTLWERGAKPSILSSDDSTLLHSAVRAGDSSQDEQRAKILSLFLGGSRHDASLPVDKRNNKGWTALKLAARKGLERSVETLLEYGADPNIPDYENYLPLHNSVCHHAILKLLVSSRHRQSINAQTQNGETPLYLAAESGNVESAVTLLEHQADPNITNREGKGKLNA